MNNQLKIFHLCPDDKFVDNAISMFETIYPGQNIVCVYTKGRQVRYIKNRIDYHASVKDVIFGLFHKEIVHASVVIVHLLSGTWYRTIEKLNEKIPVVWLGWGADYYDIIDPCNKRLLDKTFELEKRLQTGRTKTIKGCIQAVLESPCRKAKIIERINYFSPVIPGEYHLLKSAKVWCFFPEQVDWNYSTSDSELSDYICGNYPLENKRTSILIGNSATSTNNHLEAFDLIETLSVVGRSIVVPLSYGDASYREEIIKNGQVRFGEYFDAIVDYMPIDLYMKRIAQCGFVIMNHVRQQAVGNILIMLYLGGKVFLREEAPTYIFLKEAGLHIFTVQALTVHKSLLDTHLTAEEVVENRNIIDSIWSRRVLIEKTGRLIEIATDKGKSFEP